MQTPFADPTQLTHIKYAYTSRNKTNFSKKWKPRLVYICIQIQQLYINHYMYASYIFIPLSIYHNYTPYKQICVPTLNARICINSTYKGRVLIKSSIS